MLTEHSPTMVSHHRFPDSIFPSKSSHTHLVAGIDLCCTVFIYDFVWVLMPRGTQGKPPQTFLISGCRPFYVTATSDHHFPSPRNKKSICIWKTQLWHMKWIKKDRLPRIHMSFSHLRLFFLKIKNHTAIFVARSKKCLCLHNEWEISLWLSWLRYTQMML